MAYHDDLSKEDSEEIRSRDHVVVKQSCLHSFRLILLLLCWILDLIVTDVLALLWVWNILKH